MSSETISNEEFERIGEALKDEKFKQMFFDYVTEISDPKNKELYEREIEMYEKEQGNSCCVISPIEHSCLLSLSSNKRYFINICQSDKIELPVIENGLWKLPYSVGKERDEKDETGIYIVFDVVFHPVACKDSQTADNLKTILEETAIEGINTLYNKKLSKIYETLEIKAKGTPKRMMTKEKNGSFNNTESTQEFISKIKQDQIKDLKSENKVLKITTPIHKIIHQNTIDYSKITNERCKDEARPDFLVLKIELPLCVYFFY